MISVSVAGFYTTEELIENYFHFVDRFISINLLEKSDYSLKQSIHTVKGFKLSLYSRVTLLNTLSR